MPVGYPAEFIPIKPLAAKGAGAPGSYAGHSRCLSPDRGRPPSTSASTKSVREDSYYAESRPQSDLKDLAPIFCRINRSNPYRRFADIPGGPLTRQHRPDGLIASERFGRRRRVTDEEWELSWTGRVAGHRFLLPQQAFEASRGIYV